MRHIHNVESGKLEGDDSIASIVGDLGCTDGSCCKKHPMGIVGCPPQFSAVLMYIKMQA